MSHGGNKCSWEHYLVWVFSRFEFFVGASVEHQLILNINASCKAARSVDLDLEQNQCGYSMRLILKTTRS